MKNVPYQPKGQSLTGFILVVVLLFTLMAAFVGGVMHALRLAPGGQLSYTVRAEVTGPSDAELALAALMAGRNGGTPIPDIAYHYLVTNDAADLTKIGTNMNNLMRQPDGTTKPYTLTLGGTAIVTPAHPTCVEKTSEAFRQFPLPSGVIKTMLLRLC